MRSVRPLYLFALAGAIACASAPTSGAGRDSNVITQQEIADSHESNAYDVISRSRPMFLKSHGRSSATASSSDYATVYMDGQPYGDLSALRNIPTQQIQEIRYYGGTSAALKFGMQTGSGVIEIKTK
ncbi:MAG: hypothetical protein ACREMS_13320 [Gemmatimonadaceae bacterium]